jgi:hypothetical protein
MNCILTSFKFYHINQNRSENMGINGTDQNSGFIFTNYDESKGLDMKRDSEFGLALGVGALCKAAIGDLL